MRTALAIAMVAVLATSGCTKPRHALISMGLGAGVIAAGVIMNKTETRDDGGGPQAGDFVVFAGAVWLFGATIGLGTSGAAQPSRPTPPATFGPPGAPDAIEADTGFDPAPLVDKRLR